MRNFDIVQKVIVVYAKLSLNLLFYCGMVSSLVDNFLGKIANGIKLSFFYEAACF